MNQRQIQMLDDAASGELRTDAVDMRTIYALERRGLVSRSYPNVVKITPHGEQVLEAERVLRKENEPKVAPVDHVIDKLMRG